MAGAKNIMDAVLGVQKQTPATLATRPDRPDHATTRLGIVAELAEGNIKSRLQRLVDPKICRIWSGNARRYELLQLADCQDLINGLLAQGKQEFPAIVRAVHGSAGIEYEVVCGARRHWAISWLRTNSYPDFKFLIEVRDMSDEEAFRLSDIENRDRADVSDFERAQTYLAALTQHYGGAQNQMAKRLEITESWLSRYLALARLPQEIVVCFPDIRSLGIRTAATLTPLLNRPITSRAILTEASKIAGEGLSAAAPLVLKRLIAATQQPKPKLKTQIIKSKAGAPIIEIRQKSVSVVDVRLHLNAGESLEELLKQLATSLT